MASLNGRGTLRSPVMLIGSWPMGRSRSPRTTSTDILDGDSLLNAFSLHRPVILGEDENNNTRLLGGTRRWLRGCWWYKFADVCQRWRNVIPGSASYLKLLLVRTYCTPVVDIVAHSPPFPLAADYDTKGLSGKTYIDNFNNVAITGRNYQEIIIIAS